MNQHAKRKPELMSPAGGMPQLRAAVEAGADAVYFGLQGFNARAKAMAFSKQTLTDTMSFLHERGVMGFVAVNTLVFDTELARLEDEIAGIALAGADAIIVQDVGALRLARAVAPDLAVHASTQMTITSAEGAEFAHALGATRVVLARELSLKDIHAIRSTLDARNPSIELEVFVHGALCVSYSGQCFSSEAWGGRSANRGQCAQACRLPYELIVDGTPKDLGAYRYLLSPQDLYALEQIPDLIGVVHCLKIEGRYKDAEYVAATTLAYRDAIDRAWDAHQNIIHDTQNVKHTVLNGVLETKLALEGVYSRGLLPAFMQGTNHQDVVIGRAPRHRGVHVGQVTRVTEKGVRILLEADFTKAGGVIKPGDGMVFDAADWRSPAEPEEGGQVYEVLAHGDRLEDSHGLREVELRFQNGAIAFYRIREGDWLWRSHDPALDKEFRIYAHANTPMSRKKLSWTVYGCAGEALRLEATDELGRVVEAVSSELLQVATRRPLDASTLEVELGKLGDTPFELDRVNVKLEGDLFLPLSTLSKTRRAALDDLIAWRREPEARTVHAGQLEALQQSDSTPAPSGAPITLSVLVRRPDQLEAAIAARPDEIVLDYLELYGLRPSVERVLESGIRVVVASPRILKPAEERIHHFLLSLPAAILVRSVGLLKTLLEATEKPVLYGDFSLNAANGITAREFLEMGLEKLTLAYDLNANQIQDVARYVNPNKLEITAYHHLPVFHTEHCVFCRFMSTGTDHTNCGHPCETHSITLRDERGFEHPVLADVGCRNTVFEARAQSGARYLDAWQAAGIKRYRLEFVDESPEIVRDVIRGFQDAFCGRLDAKSLEHKLNQLAPSGITAGSFSVPVGGLEMLPMM